MIMKKLKKIAAPATTATCEKDEVATPVEEVPFYLPDEELQIEDYMKIKDLTKPNSLSTGTEAKKLKPTLGVRGAPLFKVNQMVLFKDPVSRKDAYGQIVSEWDQKHGTSATPAIIRGEGSLVFYIVQQHGLLVDVEYLVDLVPGLTDKLNGPLNSDGEMKQNQIDSSIDDGTVISYSTHSTLLVKGTDKSIPLRKEYQIANSVNKRLKDLRNILSLGPKYHLRDLRDPKNIVAKQLHPEAFPDDLRTHYSVEQSMISSTLPGPLTTIPSVASLASVARGNGVPIIEHKFIAPSIAVSNSYPQMRKDKNGIIHRGVFENSEVSISERSIEAERTMLSFKPRLSMLQQYHEDSLQQQQQLLLNESKRVTYEKLDLNLYADIDGDSQTLLSYYNPHYKPLPAPQRSYEDLLRSQDTFPIDKSVQNSLRVVTAENRNYSSMLYEHTDRYSNGSKEPPPWASFLVVGEEALQSLQDYIEDIERRKRQLLTRIFNRQDYLWMKLQLHRKFRYWKNNLLAIWMKRQHFCATRIQTRARVWLCRNQLNDLREYWAEVYESRRRAVHAQFRFSHAGNKYACTYDNKKFFATQADLNRYCRFLALMLSRITRFMNRKRLRLLGKTITVWKSAIYDFIESTLQNEHIDMQLVEWDRRMHGEFSIEREKLKMIETFDMLLESLPAEVRTLEPSEKHASKKSNLWYDNRQNETVSSWPLRVEPPLSFFDTHKSAQVAMQQVQDVDSLQRRYEETVPPYDPATLMPYLPELPRIQRPTTFKERLHQDVASASASSSSAVSSSDPHSYFEGRVPMAGPVSHSYWMLPQVVMVGDAPFGPAHVNTWKLVPTYEFFAEKRIYHHEPFPMELQYPYESGCNGFLKDEDIDIVGGVTMIKRNKQRAAQRQQEAMHKSVNPLMKPPRKKEILTAITQLLMSGVDTFVSLLSPEQEKLVEEYYQSPPMPTLINEAMEKAQLTANRIIVDNQDVIHKQEEHLEKIPNYGRTDPRYPQAFREKLRCQARIALAESNIARIRQQVKSIPTNGIKFHRLPVMQHTYPWTIDHVLPSIWKMEKIIAETMKSVDPRSNVHGKIYFYGGGLASNEDGPARDGRAGLFMAMILGRLYHIDPQETLFRWQKAHNCMPALQYMKATATSSATTYLTNCPPLPWQKNLLFDVLQRSHLPLDYPTIRIQLEPDRFQDLQRNHYDESLRYQVQMVQAALESQAADDNVDDDDDQQQGQSKSKTKKRAPSPPAFKVPGIKIRSNAGVVSLPHASGTSSSAGGGRSSQDEADHGYSIAYVEAERQEAILRSGRERMKQSEYFHQELVWPPPDQNTNEAAQKPGSGMDFSRKHRSALVMTGSGKSANRESHREAESRKSLRKAAKREAHKRKLVSLAHHASSSSTQGESESYAYDDGSDDAVSWYSESSDVGSITHRSSVLLREEDAPSVAVETSGRDDSWRVAASASTAAADHPATPKLPHHHQHHHQHSLLLSAHNLQLLSGGNDNGNGNGGGHGNGGGALHTPDTSYHQLHALSPMKEAVNEDEA